MKNGKNILAVLMMAGVLLAGCGKTAEPSEKPEGPEEKPQEIVTEKEPEVPEQCQLQNQFVFQNGVPFTQTQPVLTVNNPDGTYRYEDRMQDGLTTVVNTVFAASTQPGETVEQRIQRLLKEQGDGTEYDFDISTEDEDQGRFPYPAYRCEWNSGSKDAPSESEGLLILADDFGYLYSFTSTEENMDQMEDEYEEILDGIELAEMAF